MAKKSPGSILKRKGLIPGTWDLRSLSRGQKSWITKQAREYKNVIKSPDKYSTIAIHSAKEKSQAVSAGLPIVNNRALVYHKGGGVRRTKDGGIRIREPSGRRLDVSFSASDNFLKELDKARRKKLARNQAWGFMIGGRLAGTFPEFADLMHYLNMHTQWEHSDEDSENPTVNYVSLVLITEGRPDLVAHNTSSYRREWGGG